MRNRLADALSPYLLQHAENPVDWYEWGDEAFERARELERPIFLSIGYATCHWCHVMAHESFEDEAVAALLNEHFVSVKLDREERPDIDALYMTVCQAVTGHGGWPLTVFLTPDREPFYVGTYFPRDGRGQRPGMMQLLPAVVRAWSEGRDQVVKSAADLVAAVERGVRSDPPADGDLSGSVADRAHNELAARFDDEHGGFGVAPKFPTPHNLLFLAREHARTGDAMPLRIIRETLLRMRLGGIWDHVGFGFHRYSTDREWLLPHFEKMLYDQALLALAYTDAWQAMREPLFRRVAEDIFAYVDRDLTGPAGAFFSAEDADSRTASGEMEEGAFYVWSWHELAAAVPDDLAPLALAIFNVSREGNFLEEATRERTGQNVLHLSDPLHVSASRLGVDEAQLERSLEEARLALFHARADRERPLLDDKILTDWNGLMIAALARAAWVFDEPAYAERASRAAEFLLAHLRDDRGRLLHRYRAGTAGVHGFADDYAFLAWGLLELHQATFDPRWLREAIATVEALLAHFWDDAAGGLYNSPDDGERLLVRQKEYYDGATPSANSVAAYVLPRLAHLTGRMEWRERAEAILRSSGDISAVPSGHTMAATAIRQLTDPMREIVIAGEPDAPDTRALLAVVRERFLPNAVVHLRGPEPGALADVAPYVRQQGMRDGAATAYVCEHFACRQPVTDPDELRLALA